MKNFEKYDFDKDLSYCSPAIKDQWHRNAKAALKALAEELGLTPDQYDLRSNKAGIAVSGEVTLHSDKIYIQVSAEMQRMVTNGGILYRLCHGRNDYCGGQNHYKTINTIKDTKSFAKMIKSFMTPILQVPTTSPTIS